jgi:hypothetical protein
MTNNTAPVYRLSYTQSVRAALRLMGQRAKQKGIEADFALNPRTMEQRLRADAKAVGECLRTLHHLGLEVHVAGFKYSYLDFAVDEARRIVYILRCFPSARLT